MHELSLAEDLREIIESEAGHQGFSRVRRVRLEIGCLSCVEPEALRFCFAEAMKGSVAEGAVLEIVSRPGLGRCPDCGRQAPMAELHDLCSRCRRPLEVLQGMEIKLQELEVSD